MNEQDTEFFIRELRGQLSATRVLAYAALASHPDPALALKRLVLYREQIKATMLASTVPEHELAAFDRAVEVGEKILWQSGGIPGA